MSGIAGILSKNSIMNQSHILNDMMESMKHRGSDDQGLYLDEHIGLAYTYSSNSKQPIEYQNHMIIYDGVLYNADEIRETLINQGIAFDTDFDTEVIVKAYIAYGNKCLEFMNGIFSFAIYEKDQHILFLARDPFGIKPLFYSIQANTFIFSSEIKTLLKHPLVQPIIDSDGIHQLFYLGPSRKIGSGIFRDIQECRPGEYMILQDQLVTKDTYYQLKDMNSTDSLEEALRKTEILVTNSIIRQMKSNAEIGCFLSGGLDSSIITSIASTYMKEQGKQLKTFSLHYTGNDEHFKSSYYQPNRDDTYIDEMVKSFDTDHTKIYLTFGECMEALYEAVDARDLPGMADIDSSLLLLCRKVRQKVDIGLSGECADEIFGGYPWFFDEKALFSDTFPWNTCLEKRQSFLRKKWQIDIESYMKDTVRDIHEEITYHSEDEIDIAMKKLTYLNIMNFMQTLLERSDRMSMYNGLEVRVPFCDKDIAQYLFSTSWLTKIYTQREKGLLREAMRNHLPSSIIERKKSPFPKTHHPAYITLLREEFAHLLKKPYEPIFQLADSKALKILLTDELEDNWFGQLMSTPQTIAYFLQLNYWMKKYHVRIES